MMRRLWSRLRRDEQGQDLIEYSLLIAFLAIATVGLFVSTGNSTASIWQSAGTQLTSANSTATGAATTTAAPAPPPTHHDRDHD